MTIRKTCERQSNNHGHNVNWLQFELRHSDFLHLGFEFPCCYEKLIIYIEGRLTIPFKPIFHVDFTNKPWIWSNLFARSDGGAMEVLCQAEWPVARVVHHPLDLSISSRYTSIDYIYNLCRLGWWRDDGPQGDPFHPDTRILGGGFHRVFYGHHRDPWGNNPIWLIIMFQLGWKHQLDKIHLYVFCWHFV